MTRERKTSLGGAERVKPEEQVADYMSLTERYRLAYYGGDFESLRGLLAQDFTFSGPMAAYRGIEEFLQASDHVPQLVKSVETQTVFSHGNQVCAILTLTVDHRVKRFPIVEWYRFEGDRIASIQTIFDTSPFIRRAAEDAHTAVDPVCPICWGFRNHAKTIDSARTERCPSG